MNKLAVKSSLRKNSGSEQSTSRERDDAIQLDNYVCRVFNSTSVVLPVFLRLIKLDLPFLN